MRPERERVAYSGNQEAAGDAGVGCSEVDAHGVPPGV